MMFTRWRPLASVLIALIALVWMSPTVYPSNGLPVCFDGEVFLGREAEIQTLSEWIENPTVNIISIVGSPGFGKSTLAIHVGHVITEMGGVAVHYADLYEVPDITSLMNSLIFLVHGKDRQPVDTRHPLSKLKVPTVLILDNCDEVLHQHKDAFQNLIKNLVRQSQFLTVMLTAKQMTSFLGSFRNLTLTELLTDSAANVLQKLSSTLDRTMALEIASLVGNVPLALQVVGSLLTQVDPSTIANDLRRDPIPALSPELLPSTERVFTSLNISYHYLVPQHQRCGMLLARFPGSFDNSAVQGILEGKLVNDTSKCLKALQHKSLLSYDAHTQRYRYHQLIKEFFTYISSDFNLRGSEPLSDTFFHHFQAYYVTLVNNYEMYEAIDGYHFLDTERSNIDFLTSYTYKTNSNYDSTISKLLTKPKLRLYKMILDTVRQCKSLHFIHLKSPLFGVLHFKLAVIQNGIIGELINSTQLVKNTLQDSDHLDPLALLLQNIYTDMIHFYSSILRGDIHSAVSLGIFIGLQGVLSFDSNFMAISIQKGLPVSLELYVDMLVQLSELEAIMHGKQKAVTVLLLRYTRITELYSNASENDLESRQVYIKYHSALERYYILLGQFHKFLEHRRKILELKWSLAKCKQVECTPTHLALAYFGLGDYEQSAKYLEPLLQSKSLKGNRRVQLFILLYESHKNLGNTERAAHLLGRDHHISRFPSIRSIRATDYVDWTKLSIHYDEHQGDHSEKWLLDKECMTVSSKNCRTCMMLAGFYRSLKSEDATKLGRVLNRALRHFVRRRHYLIEMWWYNYDMYSRVSKYKSRSNFEILMTVLAFLGIPFVAVIGCIVMLRQLRL